MKTYVFVDASNLFYGGEKSLGWKIDYKKLLNYLKKKYKANKFFYFGGVEIYDFKYNYLSSDTVPLTNLENHLKGLIRAKSKKFNEAELLLIGRHLNRVRFYKKLENFGYKLFLKPVKTYEQDDGSTKRKANCDVEMAFYLMKEKGNYDKALILSGDGDFLPVLKYLKDCRKQVVVLARGPRTAKEIRLFAGSDFKDFVTLRKYLEFEYKRK
jgi:uncharacterized LabA/DUF88 family protein